MAEREKIVSDAAKRWMRGTLPTTEYYAEVYKREREEAEKQVARRIFSRSRTRGRRGATAD
jgi:hypothetical protein